MGWKLTLNTLGVEQRHNTLVVILFTTNGLSSKDLGSPHNHFCLCKGNSSTVQWYNG